MSTAVMLDHNMTKLWYYECVFLWLMALLIINDANRFTKDNSQ